MNPNQTVAGTLYVRVKLSQVWAGVAAEPRGQGVALSEIGPRLLGLRGQERRVQGGSQK